MKYKNNGHTGEHGGRGVRKSLTRARCVAKTDTHSKPGA